MPQGIVATVDNGFATLDFVDHSLRGPALVKLLEIGGPETIQTVSRRGPRRQYIVPEGNAREAGLLDTQARGLNADGTPSVDATGGTGTTDTTVSSAGNDSHWAADLENADPNDGSSVTGADGPAAKGTVDFHTPVTANSSSHGFVAQTPNANVLHDRSQIFTGLGTSVGGDVEHPETHAALIARVKAASDTFQCTEGTREPEPPAAVVSNALRSQPGALASDPGGGAPQPDKPAANVKLNRPQKAAKAAPPPEPPRVHLKAPEAAPVASAPPAAPETDGRPAGLPDGEPTEDWMRTDLNTYAVWKGVDNPQNLANKAEVLAAIAAKG